MCSERIHLFEHSVIFGFTWTDADRLLLPENNFLRLAKSEPAKRFHWRFAASYYCREWPQASYDPGMIAFGDNGAGGRQGGGKSRSTLACSPACSAPEVAVLWRRACAVVMIAPGASD
jgi:hypothetical protein